MVESRIGEGACFYFSIPPDIVFMDFRMPIMNGLDATRKIVASHGNAVKIVMVSASAYKQDTMKFAEAGANGCINKPFSFDDVVETIASLLSIDLVYASDESESAASRSTTMKLDIPDKYAEKILEFTEFGMVSELEEIVSELASRNDLHTESIAILRESLSRYDLNEIKRLVENRSIAA